MQDAQKKIIKTKESQLRANKKYANNRWRPNVYIDPSDRPKIERRYISKGFNSFNEYIKDLIAKDMENWKE